MNGKENEACNLLQMTVSDGLTVQVLPNTQHEYIMTTKEVANGYGVTEYAIRQNKVSLGDELTEGKHFVVAVSIPHGEIPKDFKCAHNAVLWTKRGIVRMGFTMRSERAKLFRDWAEELIISQVAKREAARVDLPKKALPPVRRHNRLTQERLLDIMVDVARIEDSELRISIVNKLMGGQN